MKNYSHKIYNFFENHFEWFFIATVVLIIFLFQLNKKTVECVELQEFYSSYNKAREDFSRTSFQIIDEADVFYSSLISVEFLSCDGKTGFFIVQSSTGDDIFKKVPVQVWKNFKNAESKDVFYFNKIKGHYASSIK